MHHVTRAYSQLCFSQNRRKNAKELNLKRKPDQLIRLITFFQVINVSDDIRTVADPGFPKVVGGGDADPIGGHQSLMWRCRRKLVCYNERIWMLRGARASGTLPRSANAINLWKWESQMSNTKISFFLYYFSFLNMLHIYMIFIKELIYQLLNWKIQNLEIDFTRDCTFFATVVCSKRISVYVT